MKALDAQIAPDAKPAPPIVPLAAAVASGHVGRYMHSGMELVSGLWLKADGRFKYLLTVGSLDETAEGRWTAAGDRIILINDPFPVPPTITQGTAKLDPAGAFHLTVALPSGRGAQGVDILIGFDGGDPVESYTQMDRWTLPKEEVREPRWVQLSMSSYRLASPRFPIDVRKANAVTYILTPNDIGVVDLCNAPLPRAPTRYRSAGVATRCCSNGRATDRTNNAMSDDPQHHHHRCRSGRDILRALMTR